jgi:hypothetical protein
MTVNDLVADALREIGVIDAGEAPVYDDAMTGFRGLNRLIDGWKAQRFSLHEIVRTVWTIVASTASYTVGSGADIDVSRPVLLNRVSYQDTSVSPYQERTLDMLTDDVYSRIMFKSQESELPRSWYYNPTLTTSGYGTLYLWPIPTATTLEGVMYAPKVIEKFTALSDDVQLAPGYEEYIVKKLAIRLAPQFGRVVDAELKEQAEEAHRILYAANKRLVEMTISPDMLVGRRSAFTIDVIVT